MKKSWESRLGKLRSEMEDEFREFCTAKSKYNMPRPGFLDVRKCNLVLRDDEHDVELKVVGFMCGMYVVLQLEEGFGYPLFKEHLSVEEQIYLLDGARKEFGIPSEWLIGSPAEQFDPFWQEDNYNAQVKYILGQTKVDGE